MNALLVLMLIAAPADQAPANQAPATQVNEPQPIEQVLAAKMKPSADHPIMVTTHILVRKIMDKKKEVSVKFVDAKGSADVNVKKWDPKVSALKPGTTILVTGELHFGPVRGGTSSIRYKVVDTKGKKYNDHRHWRTDQAIYIVNPTFVVSEETKK